MTDWEKLEPLDTHIHQGCLNCPPITQRLKMNQRLAVGFGFAGITKDGALIWSEPVSEDYDWSDLPTMMTFENMARKAPDHDWRAEKQAPLHGESYQRHEQNEWVLVASNMGFA